MCKLPVVLGRITDHAMRLEVSALIPTDMRHMFVMLVADKLTPPLNVLSPIQWCQREFCNGESKAHCSLTSPGQQLGCLSCRT
jgi:hypothetical protein